MTFEEALKECKPGEYFKALRSSWNEYNLQFGKDKTGNPFWTAGNTCGGPLTKDHTPKFDCKYGVYTKFYNDESLRKI